MVLFSVPVSGGTSYEEQLGEILEFLMVSKGLMRGGVLPNPTHASGLPPSEATRASTGAPAPLGPPSPLLSRLSRSIDRSREQDAGALVKASTMLSPDSLRRLAELSTRASAGGSQQRHDFVPELRRRFARGDEK
jgi:hypothetical protein